jgi:curved DNA-binding protein CbpA
MKTHYEVLDIPPSATQGEIKESYRLHAAAWHPDRHSQTNRKRAEEKMKEINASYQILSDARLREDYDRSLEHTSKPASMPQPDVAVVPVPGTTIQLPRDVFDRVIDLLSVGQPAMASQELFKSISDMNVPKAYEIITALNR